MVRPLLKLLTLFTMPLKAPNQVFGWLPDENKTILKKLIIENNIKSVIEVGCFVGKSTIFFCECGVDMVYAIDNFKGTDEPYLRNIHLRKLVDGMLASFMENIRNAGVLHKVQVIQGDSHKVYKSVPDADMVYIDASHKYEDVKKDIELYFPKAKLVICGDDYTDSWDGVRQAVNEAPFEANTNQRCWYYVKPKEAV